MPEQNNQPAKPELSPFQAWLISLFKATKKVADERGKKKKQQKQSK